MRDEPAAPRSRVDQTPAHLRADGRTEANGHDVSQLLSRWAEHYIWWKTPEEALAYPDRLLAQVMNLGDYADVQLMVEALGPERLIAVLHRAEIGWFNARSWHYWHHRLGLARDERDIPPLPARRVE